MNTTPARRASLELFYEGKNISEDVSKDLISATWTDKSNKEVDDLSVKLQNTHGKWYGDWLPSKGARLVASIIVHDWFSPGESLTLPCGTFQIDEISVTGGSESTVDIKAVSSPITSKLRGESKTRAWEQVTLSRIARDIAEKNRMELVFDMPKDPEYQREDQAEETDLSFLQGLCAESGASLKVTHDKIVIFSQEEKEQESAVVTITPQQLTSHSLKSKSNQVYRAARVQYHDPETNEDFVYTHEGETANLSGEDKNERELVVNRRCKSLAEAQSLAKESLRDVNKFEVSGTLSMIGDPRLVASKNIQLEGVGRFSGKYAIESATHKIGGGYTTSIEIRRGMASSNKAKNKGDGKEDNTPFRDFSQYGEDFNK